MDISPAWLIVGVVVAAFIVGGMIWAFVADRRRNEQVAHDTDRFDQPAHPADHTPPSGPTGPRHERLHVDPQYREPGER
ncbi:hypothetical protein ACFFOS_03825 [Nocardioides kongjuensis]|uniref:Uncharacterized protein n=1 Tax=Nocardioides kongjuensis TaxID=349522 RepID=A0A852R2A6_9ACTN|nr:hypothetical protein [Nocardioides kongjuensis]NYD28903.1 hypothetical protein [Nocardioides kongjuensis]